MNIILSAIFTISLILLVVCFYVLIRNERVCRFKNVLNDMGYNVCKLYTKSKRDNTLEWDENYQNKLDNIWKSINDIPYDKLLYSIIPLKIENWLTKEQQEFLKLKF